MPNSQVTINEEKKTTEEQTQQQGEVEMVGGIACPVDPMERLQCESCQ